MLVSSLMIWASPCDQSLGDIDRAHIQDPAQAACLLLSTVRLAVNQTLDLENPKDPTKGKWKNPNDRVTFVLAVLVPLKVVH